MQYSDIGYSMLGHLVRRLTGSGIDVLLHSRYAVSMQIAMARRNSSMASLVKPRR